jgi:outer membrane protein OmpA-like peptidoglycan-associated protein
MKRFLLPVLVLGAMALTVGCTTKKEVTRQTTPVMNKIDELDEQTAKTTHGIHELDDRAQKGIAGVEAKATTADQKAMAAGQQADQAQQMANTVNTGVQNLTERVVNFDNYHPVSETSVMFGFDKAVLTKKDKAELDQLGTQIPNTKGYIVQIEGRTDSVGGKDYNYGLSKRRADAVTQYLASKYGVPAHKIYIIGLGKDAPVGENSSRAENRRVDIRLMTNNTETNAGMQQPASQQPGAAASPQY